MRSYTHATVALALGLLGAFGAAQPQSGDEYVVPPDTTVQGNVVTVDKTVHIKGRVEGSVFATRGEVYLHEGSEVTGDVVVSGGKLHHAEGAAVGGSVTVVPADGVEAAGGGAEPPEPPVPPEPPTPPVPPTPPESPTPPVAPSAPPSSSVGEIVRFGQPVTVPQHETVNGDVVSFGGPVTVEGTVQGDVASFGGPVTIEGTVHGDVASTGGPLTLGDHAVVDGDAVAIGGPLSQSPSAVIKGTTKSVGGPLGHIPLPLHTWHPPDVLGPLAAGLGSLFGAVCLALLAALTVLLAPRAANTIAAKVEDEPVRVALYGIVGWLLVAPVMLVLVVLCVTWILIPFALLGLAGLLVIGYVGFCLYAGKRTARMFRWRIASPALVAGLGVIVLWVLGLVGLLPHFGALLSGLLYGAVMVMSLGAALMTRFGTDPSGTWLHRRGHANGRWPYEPGPTPVAAPASPPPAAGPTADLDLDEKTLEALRDLPDEPDAEAPAESGAEGQPPAS